MHGFASTYRPALQDRARNRFDCQNNLRIFGIPSTIRVRLNELDVVQSLSRYRDEG